MKFIFRSKTNPQWIFNFDNDEPRKTILNNKILAEIDQQPHNNWPDALKIIGRIKDQTLREWMLFVLNAAIHQDLSQLMKISRKPTAMEQISLFTADNTATTMRDEQQPQLIVINDQGWIKPTKHSNNNQDLQKDMKDNVNYWEEYHKLPTNFVLLDTETTGFSRHDKIIQFSAIKVNDLKIVDTYNQLINPQKNLPRKITSLTHIHEQDLFDKPTFETVLPNIQSFIGKNIIVGHNIRYDLRMLCQECTMAKQAYTYHQFVDTLELSKKIIPGLLSYKLENLKQLLPKDKISDLTSHNALNDIKINLEVYKLIKQKKAQKVG